MNSVLSNENGRLTSFTLGISDISIFNEINFEDEQIDNIGNYFLLKIMIRDWVNLL